MILLMPRLGPVPFDAGPSWAGLIPISGAQNETRKLFFWSVQLGISVLRLSTKDYVLRFWPTNNPANGDDLLFWTNGSSLDAWKSSETF